VVAGARSSAASSAVASPTASRRSP
jgi:hypothetical protein